MKQLKDILINRATTNFLRLVMAVMAGVAVLLFVLIVPGIFRGWNAEYPNATYVRIPFVFLLTLSAIIFFAVLYQAAKLLKYIDKNKTFSTLMTRALKNIKYLAAAMSTMHVLLLPCVFVVADQEDAPGLVLMGMLFALAPLAISVFAALMQRLLQNAIDIKSENDLTV